jgi:glutamate-1-semialdehyde 2,1-aminomutase
VRYVNSGTEASLHATRLVRAVTGKPKIAKFEGAYHGSHDALEVSVSPAVDRAGPADSPTPVAEWDGLARSAEEDVVLLPYNQPESVELILREHQEELAAVFFDGKPGMLDLPPAFARFVRDLTRELGILMVMDEVISFRVGYQGYQGLTDIDPDVTVLGKIVGGGFPVGAFGGRADLMDSMDNTQGAPQLNVSGTFSGNNLTLAAGLATLRALTPDVYDRLDGLRERLHQGMVAVFDGAGVDCQVVSAGSMLSLYMTEAPVRDYRAMAGSDKPLYERLRLALMMKGQNAPGGLGLTLTAPMGTEHIDGLLEATAQALAESDS